MFSNKLITTRVGVISMAKELTADTVCNQRTPVVSPKTQITARKAALDPIVTHFGFLASLRKDRKAW
jgi:hypothetical protein